MKAVTHENAREHLRLDIPAHDMTEHEQGLADLIARHNGHPSFYATVSAWGMWGCSVGEILDHMGQDAPALEKEAE